MNPILVNLWRGNAIESRHRGAVAVVDARGRVVFSLGDIQRSEYPRSAIKFLQAIPLVESGAIDHFGLTDQHLSLACSSHNGELAHTDLVNEWLGTIDCTADDLECGAEMPLDKETQFNLMASKGSPRRYHHNCSGKHAGLLTTCRFFEENIKNYRLYNHPAQRRWFDVVENLTGIKAQQLPWGYDGCGIPTLTLPLQRMAYAFARFSEPEGLSPERATAMERIGNAVAAHPYMVAGRNRLCTALMEITGREVLVKTGAEGYYTATLAKEGYGIALKIDDGATRASMVAIGAVLEKLGVLSVQQYRELEEYVQPELTNSRGEAIGRAEPSSEWD